MRILITGGAGFIGSHLCDKLLSEGHEVICMDNLITGDTANIDHIRDKRFSFIQYDVDELYLCRRQDRCHIAFCKPCKSD